jgi:GNAT superfamily N-acetyltransferase
VSVTLRAARKSDQETLILLWLELVTYNISIGARRPLRWSNPNEFARTVVTDALARPEKNHVVVAVDETDTVVGFCHTQLLDEPEPCPGHVNTLIVKTDHRGRGTGGLLLDDALAWCRDCGANEVSLHVAAGAADSRRFYEHNGMEEVHVLMIKRLGSDEPV